MKSDLILVIGASGTVGSQIVKQLKSEGYRVRTTTSKASLAAGADSVHVNLVTGEGLKAAFDGVDRAFFLSPPGYADQYKILSPLIQEAKRRGLKKVVLMTAIGANAVATSPFRLAELELEKSGLSYNIIRPNWFMQNFNTFWLQDIQQKSQILLPAGNAKTSFIDSRDISAVAAKLLVSDQWNNRDFDLTGSDSITHEEVANILSKALGQKITYQNVEPQTLKEKLLKAGLPEDYTNMMLMIFGFLKEGYVAATTDSVKSILGRNPISFAQYAQAFKKAF